MVTDYGVCDLMDLLSEIPDTTITITHQATDTVISVPKRGPFKNTSFIRWLIYVQRICLHLLLNVHLKVIYLNY